MPTMTTPDAPPLPTVTIDAADPKAALASEWLLTNGLGGFAMGTPAAVNTRRYHALLVASLNPPVDRVVALSAVADTVTLQPGSSNEHAVTLTPFHFEGNADRPAAAPAPCRFERTPAECRWIYTIETPAGPCTVTRTLRLFDGRNAAAINYRVESPVPVRLALRPLTGLRDFHELTTGNGHRRLLSGPPRRRRCPLRHPARRRPPHLHHRRRARRRLPKRARHLARRPLRA